MKICHITTVHNRYDDRIFQKECVSLAKKYDVHLLVNDNLDDEDLKGVCISSIRKVHRGVLGRIIHVRNAFKSALKIDADVYHLHDPELLLIASNLLKYNKKVIFDSHEYYYEQIKTKEYLPKVIRKVIARLYRKYETYICKKISAVISVCPLRNDGIVYNPFEGRCRVHTYLANFPVYREIEREVCKHKKDFYVCYAGGITHERGITYLIDACYAANCKLVLAGTFSSDEYRMELQQKESYKCVDYRGQCKTDEVFQIYQNASIGASTLLDCGQYYKIETFPVKVYEYLQMGLPVLISDYPYAQMMNEKHHFGVCVKPNDINNIVEAIIEIKNNTSFRNALGENGFRLYYDKLNWNKEKQKLYEIYNILVNEG